MHIWFGKLIKSLSSARSLSLFIVFFVFVETQEWGQYLGPLQVGGQLHGTDLFVAGSSSPGVTGSTEQPPDFRLLLLWSSSIGTLLG
jgi:hypothetical protein